MAVCPHGIYGNRDTGVRRSSPANTRFLFISLMLSTISLSLKRGRCLWRQFVRPAGQNTCCTDFPIPVTDSRFVICVTTISVCSGCCENSTATCTASSRSRVSRIAVLLSLECPAQSIRPLTHQKSVFIFKEFNGVCNVFVCHIAFFTVDGVGQGIQVILLLSRSNTTFWALRDSSKASIPYAMEYPALQ